MAALWRYPVKSMRGEACEALEVEPRGVRGDRLYAVRDSGGLLGSGKSTRRFRQLEGLFDFESAWREEGPEIVFPDARRLSGADPAIHDALSAHFATPVTLSRENAISHHDASPLHLLTSASLAWLRTLLPDARIDERRFRPNLLIDLAGAEPIEQSWIGKTLRIGAEVRLRITAPTERCRMVTLAQADLPADPRILGTLSRAAALQFGVYAEVLRPGRITRNDRVIAD